MNGDVTNEGITADLKWMKRTGIGGMQMFDGNLGTPQFVDKRLVWISPEWKDAFRHTASEAERLGLEMSMAALGGWSEAEGPWVKPHEAIKKVVWSQTRLEGPRMFTGTLPNPPSVNGPLQSVPRPRPFDFPQQTDLPGAKPAPKLLPPAPDPSYYADSVVIAYRDPDGDVRMADLHPKVTSSAGDINAAALMDGDLSQSVSLPLADGAESAWIEFEFVQPFRAQAFTIAGEGGGQFGVQAIPDGQVQASKDGKNFVTLQTLPGPGDSFAAFPVRTYLFPETVARFFRVLVAPPAPARRTNGAGKDTAQLELPSLLCRITETSDGNPGL